MPVAEKIKGIEVDNISFSWVKHPKEQDFIFRNISFSIKEGEFVSFIGPSGCGKSTLLNIISGLLAPYSGHVIKNGMRITEPDKDLGFVFQDYSLFPWLNVKNNVRFGLNLNGHSAGEITNAINPILKRVGLWEARKKFPFQLSGGMKQRTAIARVLANNACYLLMDEPFGALDYQTRLNMQTFITEIYTELCKTVLFVTHHVDEAVMLSDRVFLLGAGQKTAITELVIDLPRPRDVSDPKFADYRRYIINYLNKEVYF